jgi:hypothetical protein
MIFFLGGLIGRRIALYLADLNAASGKVLLFSSCLRT